MGKKRRRQGHFQMIAAALTGPMLIGSGITVTYKDATEEERREGGSGI